MHSTVYVVNGKATDTTRKAPVLVYEDTRLGRPADCGRPEGAPFI